MKTKTEQVEETIIEVLKSEKEPSILYYGTNRLFFDGVWQVRAGQRKHNELLYHGESLEEALDALVNQ